MPRAKIKWALIAWVALAFGGLVSLYQALFDLWMTAYPFASVNEWRTRLYIRLATTIGIAACCRSGDLAVSTPAASTKPSGRNDEWALLRNTVTLVFKSRTGHLREIDW